MISVLLVDDEPVLVDIGRLFLEKAGHFSVYGCLSAEEAEKLLEENSYDAIIADYQMPKMNGIDLLKIVREKYGDIPFILFTGRGREDVARDAVNIGADYYIQKGGDPKLQFADIAHKIETSVERRRALIAIKISEQRFYDIINFLPDATFAINTKGTIIAWNREMERITGAPGAQMMGKSGYAHAVPFYGYGRPMIIDLLLRPDPVIESKYRSLIRENGIITAEGALHLPDRTHFFLARASFLYDQNGKPAGAIESLRDITGFKETEEKMSRIIHHLPVGIHLFKIQDDGKLHCHGGNTASGEVFGIVDRCIKGTLIEDLFPGEEGTRICSASILIAKEGGRKVVENVHIISGTDTKQFNLTIFQSDTEEVAILYMPVCGA